MTVVNDHSSSATEVAASTPSMSSATEFPTGYLNEPATRGGNRMWLVARTELLQLMKSKDFWLPMSILGAMFFVIIPACLFLLIGSVEENSMATKVAGALELLPQAAQSNLEGSTPSARTSYALAVYLFAPIAVVVPLTISTAVGAASLVGERERGTGEFLAHSPAGVRDIYFGKILASFVPGYLTTLLGFASYSLLVNTIIGPRVGRWFFPTGSWVVLMMWIVPAFLVIALSLVLRLSARVKSTAAAQQASGLITLPLIALAYGQSTGLITGGSVMVGVWIGVVAWAIALISLARGVRSVTRTRLLGVAQ